MRKAIPGVAAALLLLSGTAYAADPDAPQPAPTQATAAMERTGAEHLIGKDVVGSANEEIGTVKDVILDPQSGKARQLVVASGGFLGIGGKLVAVDYNDAELDERAAKVLIPDLSRAQIQAMREFTYDDNMVALSRTTDMDRTSVESTTRAPDVAK